MLEAQLQHATTLKKLLDAVKDLINDVNFNCNDTGIALQAMDHPQVCLITLLLRSSGFEHYRCDRNLNLGLSLLNLSKIMKSVGPDDVLLLKADDKGDILSLMFQNDKSDRVSEYDLKLMDIDCEQLGVPDTEYDALIEMSSQEFKRIVTDLSALSESVTVSVTKEGITFAVEGDIGSGSITLKPGSGSSIDEKDDDDNNNSNGTTIDLKQSVSAVLSLKYLMNFTKATALSNKVTIGLIAEIPMMVEYKVASVGYIRYYLAPKMNDDDE